MGATVLGLAAAALGCGGGVTGALADAAAGRRPLAGVRIEYREERPLRGDVRVDVTGEGDATVTTERVVADCADPRSPACRETAVRHLRLAAAAHRALAGAIARAQIERVPRDDQPAPGADRLSLGVDVDGVGRAATGLGVEAALARPELAAARQALLSLAASERPPSAPEP